MNYTFLLCALMFIILLFCVLQRTVQRTCDNRNIIETLYRQCARWSTASTQDKNPVVANLHANYAAGYLWALEDLFTSDEITMVTGIDHKIFRKEIQKNQDITTQKVISACPKFATLDKNASKLVANIAGEL